jgi:hypothetical protein
MLRVTEDIQFSIEDGQLDRSQFCYSWIFLRQSIWWCVSCCCASYGKSSTSYGVSMLEGSYLGGPAQLVRSPREESSVDAVMCEVHRDLLFISYIDDEGYQVLSCSVGLSDVYSLF